MRKSNQRIKRLSGILAAGLFMSSALHAATPLWTYSAPSPANVTVSDGGIANIQYLVTNQSSRPKELSLKATPGLSAPVCRLAGKGSSCMLTLTVTGSQIPLEGLHRGPVLCETGNPHQCYQPSANRVLNINKNISNTTSLQVSLSELAIKVDGKARILVIKNTGSVNADNVTYILSPALPNDAHISPASCGTIPPSGTCLLTITPGATVTAEPGDLNPIPVSAEIAGSNTNTVHSAIHILTYGSVYQGGYIFSMNDSPPPEQSINGKVLAKTYQAKRYPGGITWGEQGLAVGGISIDSVEGVNSCNGISDGACNTGRVIARLTGQPTPGLPLMSYAAGLCKAEMDGYTDWYLPAICEQTSSETYSFCPIGMENIASNLPDLLGIDSENPNDDPDSTCHFASMYPGTVCIAGMYWSSTEGEGDSAENIALNYSFDINSYAIITKSYSLGVRCARGF